MYCNNLLILLSADQLIVIETPEQVARLHQRMMNPTDQLDAVLDYDIFHGQKSNNFEG